VLGTEALFVAALVIAAQKIAGSRA